MSRPFSKLNIASTDAEFELLRHRSLMESDRTLDGYTEVTWVPVTDQDVRCSQRYETKHERLMHCSERATWVKMRLTPRKKRPDPAASGYLCDAHSIERGRT